MTQTSTENLAELADDIIEKNDDSQFCGFLQKQGFICPARPYRLSSLIDFT